MANDLTLPGKNLDVKSETVTVDSAVTVSTFSPVADSGSIKLAGETIVVSTGVKLHANATAPWKPGNVTLNASKSGIKELENLLPVFVKDKLATVDVQAGVEILAGNIGITASATDVSFISKLGRSRLVNHFVISPLAGKISSLASLGLPVQVLLKSSTATVDIGDNVNVIGSGDVTVQAKAISDSTGNVNSKLISVGYAQADANAKVNIGTGGMIDAGEAVIIRSIGNATGPMTTETSRSLGDFSPGQMAISVAVGNSDATSHVVVPAGATVVAGKTANIVATGKSETAASATSGLYSTGLAGLAFGIDISNADIKYHSARTCATAAWRRN